LNREEKQCVNQKHRESLHKNKEDTMKSLMKSTLSVFTIVLGAALAVVPARAQSGNRVSVNVPVDFSVGDTPLKAGIYKIAQLESGILVFSSEDGRQHQVAFTLRGDSANRNQTPHLDLTRYGSEVFLNRVFLSGSDECNNLVRSSREKKLIRERASGEELSLLIQPVR
jgi:hypothetical protein